MTNQRVERFCDLHFPRGAQYHGLSLGYSDPGSRTFGSRSGFENPHARRSKLQYFFTSWYWFHRGIVGETLDVGVVKVLGYS